MHYFTKTTLYHHYSDVVSSGNNLILKYSYRGVIKLPHLPQIKKIWSYFISLVPNKWRLPLNNI
jgi:hypothetical protein